MLCAEQQLLAESNTAHTYSSIKKCQNSWLFIPGLSFTFCYKSWSFTALPQKASHMQILKKTCPYYKHEVHCVGEYRDMKSYAVNITPDFSKNCQSYKDRELWRALKNIRDHLKGAVSLEDSVGKKKGHWVKVRWEVCNQENLPIKGTPSEHNVLSDYFIRKSIYNCFLLLWTENDRRVKALHRGGQADCGSLHSLKD